MDNQPNFRQAGVKSSGKLLIGASHAHHAAHGKRGMGNASIPSKFECILYAGSKEQDGFASRVSRFSENTADLPGTYRYIYIYIYISYHTISLPANTHPHICSISSYIYMNVCASYTGPGHYSSPTSFTKPTHNKLAREGRVTTRDARSDIITPTSRPNNPNP